jgi:LPXTG-motif cell wall-anchored protein
MPKANNKMNTALIIISTLACLLVALAGIFKKKSTK